MTDEPMVDVSEDDGYCPHCYGVGCGACSAATWPDAGSIDPHDYTEVECFVAGRLSTMPPFADQFSPRALPFARQMLEALGEWEPSDDG